MFFIWVLYCDRSLKWMYKLAGLGDSLQNHTPTQNKMLLRNDTTNVWQDYLFYPGLPLGRLSFLQAAV